MELNQDVFFKEYYNLQEAIKSNIHRRIWREIEGSKKQLYDALADQEQQKDVIEIMQLVSSQKDIQNKINGI